MEVSPFHKETKISLRYLYDLVYLY